MGIFCYNKSHTEEKDCFFGKAAGSPSEKGGLYCLHMYIIAHISCVIKGKICEKNGRYGMRDLLKTVFAKEKIEYFGVIPFSACTCRRPDVIERRGVSAEKIQTAIIFLIPYFVNDGEGNVSFYARSRDYHVYCEGLFSRIIPILEKQYGERFLGFADKSPIRENLAASMAGLGVIGDNFMLINEKYGSFVFVAEILSVVPPETLGFSGGTPAPSFCSHCGACRSACPMTKDGLECLSAVTQKKGLLTTEEEAYLKKYGYAWGCDICQLACPMTKAALTSGVQTPIAFFHEDRIPLLTKKRLSDMDEEEFRRRAFSWRGREPLLRNLDIFEK